MGGAIRDYLKKTLVVSRKSLVVKTKDYDFVVRKNAQGLAKAFTQKIKGRLIELDEERKIYRVIVRRDNTNYQFDFANFQGKTIEEDLSQRDFTINAMAIKISNFPRHSGESRNPVSLGVWTPAFAGVTKELRNLDLIDPCQGIQDLRAKKIRAISERSFKEDPLRLLRAFRFHATLGFTIEPKTLRWIAKYSAFIRRPAPERIRAELMEMLRAPSAYPSLKLMDQTRLLTKIFPVLEKSRNLARGYYKRGGVLGHSLDSVDRFEDAMKGWKKRWPKIGGLIEKYLFEEISGSYPRYITLKLATLLHDIAKPHTAKIIKGRMRFFGHDEKGAKLFAKIGERLRFSRDEIDLVCKIIKAHLRPGNLSEQPTVTDRAIYRFFRDLGEDGVAVLLVALADHQSYMKPGARWAKSEKSVHVIRFMLEKYFLEAEKVVPPKLITGHDVMRTLGITPSPKVGEILEKIQSLQAEGKIKTKTQALAHLQKLK